MNADSQIIAYTLNGNCYLNVTNRCTLRCAFCPKFNKQWTVRDYALRLAREPTVVEMLEAVGDPARYKEIVFCGLGDPGLRIYECLHVGRKLRERGATVRMNTDGLASLLHERDVTPDLEGGLDALSVSLNAHNEEVYNRHCRPGVKGAYQAMLDFVERAKEFVPKVAVTAINGLEGVDIAACREIAEKLGVEFRERTLGKVG